MEWDLRGSVLLLNHDQQQSSLQGIPRSCKLSKTHIAKRRRPVHSLALEWLDGHFAPSDCHQHTSVSFCVACALLCVSEGTSYAQARTVGECYPSRSYLKGPLSDGTGVGVPVPLDDNPFARDEGVRMLKPNMAQGKVSVDAN